VRSSSPVARAGAITPEGVSPGCDTGRAAAAAPERRDFEDPVPWTDVVATMDRIRGVAGTAIALKARDDDAPG